MSGRARSWRRSPRRRDRRAVGDQLGHPSLRRGRRRGAERVLDESVQIVVEVEPSAQAMREAHVRRSGVTCAEHERRAQHRRDLCACSALTSRNASPLRRRSSGSQSRAGMRTSAGSRVPPRPERRPRARAPASSSIRSRTVVCGPSRMTSRGSPLSRWRWMLVRPRRSAKPRRGPRSGVGPVPSHAPLVVDHREGVAVSCRGGCLHRFFSDLSRVHAGMPRRRRGGGARVPPRPRRGCRRRAGHVDRAPRLVLSSPPHGLRDRQGRGQRHVERLDRAHALDRQTAHPERVALRRARPSSS